MRSDTTAPRSLGLSCYTENLARYLTAYVPDATGRLARSVRLALQPDTRCFSHHAVALNDLPGRRRLGYRAAPSAEAALHGVADELAARGRVLAVADSGSLPWSRGTADGHAPHLLLVDDRSDKGAGWHVVDAFAALFSTGGSQEPFSGWLTDAEFAALLAFPRGLSERHRTRNAMAFGYPVVVPTEGTCQWLVQEEGRTEQELPGGPWLTGPAAPAAAAELLQEDFSRIAAGADGAEPGVLEDLWAAAQHHLLRDAELRERHGAHLSPTERDAVEATSAKWRELPRMLRFAADSARRGRPRRSLVHGALTAVTEAEATASRVHAAFGYGAPEARPATALHTQHAGR